MQEIGKFNRRIGVTWLLYFVVRLCRFSLPHTVVRVFAAGETARNPEGTHAGLHP